MIRISNLLFSCLLMLFIACASAAAADQKYTRYCNPRYGFCVNYPAHLRMEPPPVNGDGRGFNDGQGFSLTASGINNVLDGTLESEMKEMSEEFDKVTYRIKGDNWFILSGFKGADILYIKGYVGKGSRNHLYISYPANRKEAYDKIVSEVSRSFKPGRLDQSH